MAESHTTPEARDVGIADIYADHLIASGDVADEANGEIIKRILTRLSAALAAKEAAEAKAAHSTTCLCCVGDYSKSGSWPLDAVHEQRELRARAERAEARIRAVIDLARAALKDADATVLADDVLAASGYYELRDALAAVTPSEPTTEAKP